MSIYSQIETNKRKTWLVIFLFVVFITTVAYVFGQASGYGWPYAGLALVVSALFSLGSYYFSDSLVLAISGASKVAEKDDPELYHVAENLAMAAGISRPQLYQISDNAPNAFATGRDPAHAVVAITTGLREKLNRTELEGVIAHEMSHVGNYDTRLMVIVTILVGMVAMLADWFMRSLWWRRDDRDSKGKGESLFLLVGLILAIISPLIATLIQLAISRQREFLADANAAYITRYPEGLARALEKIAADRNMASFANNATAHLFIVNPFKRKGSLSWLTNLFETHPPVEERIKLLRQM